MVSRVFIIVMIVSSSIIMLSCGRGARNAPPSNGAADDGVERGDESETAESRSGGAPWGGQPEEVQYSINARTVELANVYQKIRIDGDVKAVDSASVTPNTGGTLIAWRVREGQLVRKGQVIAQVDSSKPGQDFLPSPVYAPISGTLSNIHVTEGNPVSLNTIIADISDNTLLVVEIFVPERYVGDVVAGMNAELSLISFPEETFELRVQTVNSVLSPVTHTMKTTLQFTRSHPEIKSGMFGTVTLILEEHENVPIVRRDYLVQRFFSNKSNTGVFVIEKENDEFIAKFRVLELGIEDNNFFEVLGGIEEGEIIATSGQSALVDDSQVRIIVLDDKTLPIDGGN